MSQLHRSCRATLALCPIILLGTAAHVTAQPERQILTVDSTADPGVPGDGLLTLREAITLANQIGGGVTIAFAPPLLGATIQPTSQLPALVAGNTTISGDVNSDGQPDVTLDGQLAGAAHGLVFDSAGNTVRGLAIGRFNQWGILISGAGCTGNTVTACRIGTDAAGGVARPNGGGVLIINAATGNVIGPGNVLSGNVAQGILILGATTSANVVLGNMIGTNAAGTTALPNLAPGVLLGDNTSGNTIGPTNVVSGNGSQGLVIDGGAHHNQVVGNRVGTDITATYPIPNYWDGIVIQLGAHHNVVGGSTPAAGNVFSGNRAAGIAIRNQGSNFNVLQYNRCGTNALGTGAVPNSGQGVAIYDNSNGNIVGPNNQISGNQAEGVLIDAASNNHVFGNQVGTDPSGIAAVGNRGTGIAIRAGATGNVVGGPTPSDTNVVSGNGPNGHGIAVYMPNTSGNIVEGNRIGTNASGSAALGNAVDGVAVFGGARANTIGPNNVISGNGAAGVLLEAANDNRVLGNVIGTDVSGAVELGNTYDGVLLRSGAANNTIGGSNPQERNIISGNGTGGPSPGVNIRGGAVSNVVAGNFIGTDVSGAVALPNSGAGVLLFDGAGANVVGPGNVISANAYDGVTVQGMTASGARVSANLIGTNATCTAPLGNSGDGVYLFDGANDCLIEDNVTSGNLRGIQINGGSSHIVRRNKIGTNGAGTDVLPNAGVGIWIRNGATGVTIGPGNQVAGNVGGGLLIEGAHNNRVIGNLMGTDATGAFALNNRGECIWIRGGSTGNIVGGDAPTDRNVLSGHLNDAGSGLVISDDGTSQNVAKGNLVGTDLTGMRAVPNGGAGVAIIFGATDNVIGPGNVVSASGSDGLFISETSHENQVFGNLIGTDLAGVSPLPNGRHGVNIFNGPRDNTIGPGNVIMNNSQHGVLVQRVTAARNRITRNSISQNSAAGIMLTNGNVRILAPALSLAPPLILRGTCVAPDGSVAELFYDPEDEGRTYLGQALVQSGEFAFPIVGSIPPGCITATVTDPNGNTSEFGVATPIITQHPSGLTLPVGATATLSVSAWSTAPVSYSWRKWDAQLSDGPTGTGSIVAGSATSTLTISNIGPADAAAYAASAYGPCGGGGSDSADLVVVPNCGESTMLPYVLIASKATDAVVAFNGMSGANVRSVVDSPGVIYPNGLAITLDGRAYVSSSGSSAVVRYGIRSRAPELAIYSAMLSAPVGILLTPTTLVVSSWGTDSVKEYRLSDGTWLRDLGSMTTPKPRGPNGLLRDALGHVLVASENTNQVLRYTSSFGIGLWTVAAQGGGLSRPFSLLGAARGGLLVSSFGTNAVKRFDPNGAYLGDFVAPGSGGLDGASGMCWAPNGNLLVASRFTDRILEYDGQTGAFVRVFAGGPEIAEPTHIALAWLCDPDCNGNGVLDQWDIELLHSGDCEHDGIPDECQNVVPSGTAVTLDGAGDHLSAGFRPELNLLNGFTLEAWVKPASAAGTQRILSNGYFSPTAPAETSGYGIGLLDGSPVFTTFGVREYIPAVPALPVGAWSHVAISLNTGNDVKFYVNGQLLAFEAGLFPARSSPHAFNIGRNPSSDPLRWEPFDGVVDEVRVWNTVRTDEQVQSHYAVPLVGNEPNLAAYWKLDDAAGPTARDLAGGNDATLVGARWVVARCPRVRCLGDTDRDGDVDQDDIDTVLYHYGEAVPPFTNGDLTGDGHVTQDDIDIVLYEYGLLCL